MEGMWYEKNYLLMRQPFSIVEVDYFFISSPTDLTLFIICLFARTSRSLTLCCPFGRPMIFPFNLAVSMPFFVRCLRSPTSFCAWSKAIRIHSFASIIRYIIRYSSTEAKMTSTSVPVLGTCICNAFLYITVSIWDSCKIILENYASHSCCFSDEVRRANFFEK